MKRTADVAASVLARLKNIARTNGVAFSEILTRYAIERALKRIELSSRADQCILKGGCLFTAWNGGVPYRPTMDADMELRGRGDVDSVRELFREVASLQPDDHDALAFDADTLEVSQIRHDDEYGGVRAVMTARIANVRIRVQFDIGIGDAITPRARKAAFPSLLGMAPPRIRLYPKETVVAEKLETIAKRGLANSRMKDYYDLYVLCRDPALTAADTARAVARTFARRKTPLPTTCPFGLTDGFAANRDKLVQWNAFLRKGRLATNVPDFAEVVKSIRNFYLAVAANLPRPA